MRKFLLLLALPILMAFQCTEINEAASSQDSESEQNVKTETMRGIAQKATLIVVVEIMNDVTTIKGSNRSEDISLDVEAAKKVATEERAFSDKSVSFGKVFRLKTIEVLKGPQTDVLSLPLPENVKTQPKTGEKYLIVTGAQEHDEWQLVSSLDDELIKQYRDILAN